MDLTFGEGFSEEEKAELDAVLKRIDPERWSEPDTLHVRGRLTDGRSGCTVLDLVGHTGPSERPLVAKVGPFHDLQEEWTAYERHLRQANSFFAPIRAATPAVLGTARPGSEVGWQLHIARASVDLLATGLLPQLLTWAAAHRPEFTSLIGTGYDSRFGPYDECHLANVLRTIGYLARLLLDGDHPADAADAVTFLHARAATLDCAEHRSIVVGCTTALGFLGEWEPILTHLAPGEPWMHEAAGNIFEHWVSKDLSERERAARWIARRLRTHPDLAPEVRSTLGQLKERLEREIGRHIGKEGEDGD